MLSETLIKKLKSDTAFQEFMGFVSEQIEALDTVEGLDKLPNEQAGEEAKVRSKAKGKLIEILKPFLEFGEKKEPTAADIAEAKEKYGL